ncbi:MAG: HAMP domain-containing histidine kinase [Treponema sp.]|nr:HAMP domain-containing histidine kinase [Treponema sp.]
MYYEHMTIKRRLFISNLRMIFISFGAFFIAIRITAFLFFDGIRLSREAIERYRSPDTQESHMAIFLLVFAVFIIVISIINNFLTHRMTKQIVKPLEPINEGVRQIKENNFSYRINYNENDEFQPVCDSFNEMAAKLETSTAQKKKDEANRKELIAGISHDLRTPLTSIKGYIEGIEAGVASTSEMREKYLAIIKEKAVNIEHILEHLFLFSKLDMDEFPISMRRSNITLAISDMIEDLIPEYLNKGLLVKLTEINDNYYVNADVLLLRNVIVNILENSVRYKTKDHGHMRIAVTQEDDYILLCLTDDGPGVNPDMLPKLFDIFYRTDPSRSKQGSGLGLAICVKIIERMGGKIYAQLPKTGGLAVMIEMPLLGDET